MRVITLPLLAALYALAPYGTAVLAQVAEPGPAPPITDCRSAAQAFEQSADLPPGLLLAIGQVESGRTDPITGRTDPWPWSTNHAGEGHYFASAQEAIAWTAVQLATGNRSIDVGCFQVNLYYHPDAFASLAEAFDPAGQCALCGGAPEPLARAGRQLAVGDRAVSLGGPVRGPTLQQSRHRSLDHRRQSPLSAPPCHCGNVDRRDPVVVRHLGGGVRRTRRGAELGLGSVLWRCCPSVAGLPRVITPNR